LAKRHVGLYLLDVSGHGVAAALLSVAVRHFLTPQGDNSLLKLPAAGGAAPTWYSRATWSSASTRSFFTNRSERLFTLFYGHVNLASNTLTYANAGHPGPVILAGDGEPSVLESSGLPIGVLEQAECEDAVVQLPPGDRFWL
jgi:sigma-B regulation protein RsbU (phosphoserine phosphatase)